MPSIAVDTGPLVALFNRRDRYHARAVAFFSAERRHLVTNLPVVTETVHLLSSAAGAPQDLLRWLAPTFEIDTNTGADLPRIIAILDKYADLPADFADAALVAMCERRAIDDIATLDTDFDVYRLTDGSILHNGFRGPAAT